jgi:hypothetical protein
MGVVDCFWVTETPWCEVSLRRYISLDQKLADHPWGYCNEEVVIGRFATRRSDRHSLALIRPAELVGEKRWPISCSICGREFGPVGDGVSRMTDGVVNDQVNQEPIYRAADGREWPQRSLPPGAMFDSPWRGSFGTGPDGIALTVVCPYTGTDARNGMWHVDGPASNSDRPWDRTGDPRVPGQITASPSIKIGDMYHGWLRNGQLVEC